MAYTKYITIYVYEEKEIMRVETKRRTNYNYDYYIFNLPMDPEFSEENGLRHPKSFLNTPRGEHWLLNKLEYVADKYDFYIEVPSSIDDVNWWHL